MAPDLLSRFEERIREDLADSPLTLDSQRLRLDAGALLTRAGMVSHYELLGVSVGATTEGVTSAFIALGRRVHPSLAHALDLPEAVLRLLFEHALQAYLVLSDPVRRKAYDHEHRYHPDSEKPTDEQVADVRRETARRCFRRAQTLIRSEQYHYVVELLRDTVHWDLRPEALALLAEAQAQNPHWREEALGNMQHALRLAPEDLAYRIKLAKLYETMGRPREAIEEYQAVLSKFSNQPEAVAGLERLGAAPPSSEKKGGWFR